VWVTGVIAVLVMDTVNSYPEDWAAFERESCADGEAVFHPFWGLKTAVGEQTVVADADTEVDSQYPKDGCHCQAAPTEVKESGNRANVKSRDKTCRNPIYAAVVGFAAHANLFTHGYAGGGNWP